MHVVVADSDVPKLVKLKKEIKGELAEQYGITHSTLEFEFGEADQHCDPPRIIAEH
jgi:Co/Zn/Cd efflux system component